MNMPVTPTGCSADGPDAGAQPIRTRRRTLEANVATANLGGGVFALEHPILGPVYASGLSPQVWVVQPVVQIGVTNMSIERYRARHPRRLRGLSIHLSKLGNRRQVRRH